MDEQHQDANSALMELDKGLRAQKVGQQCEAVVRFPGLFERFPFPILINSAFLKLADVFRVGNNFLRLCILRVSQQSNKHLDKILNITEFRKRISVVVHSNDPYARAITLRMLGSIACIISDEKSVHHSVRQGLDSHDRVEQEAAIYATIQFASNSKEFATSICNKIASMLQGLSTPLEIKLKLIPVLQHMHYDVQISTKSQAVLKDLLPAYPAQDFVVTTLNTLTNLSRHSLVDIPAQVSCLLQYLRCDPREAVKAVALQNLDLLAKIGVHLWSVEDTDELCKAYSLAAMQSSLKSAILHVLCTLASGDTVLHLDIQEGSALITLCRKCCYDKDVRQAALSSLLLSRLTARATQSERGSSVLQTQLLEECADAIESLMLVLVPTSDHCQRDRCTLQLILPAISILCKVSEPKTTTRLIEMIVSLLTMDCQPVGRVACMLYEIMASIATKSKKPGLLMEFSPSIMELLKVVVESEDVEPSSAAVLQKVITHICTLLFLSNQCVHDSQIARNVLSVLTKEDSAANEWTWYRVARQASRLGEHELASKLFLKLASLVASEQYYFWLIALHQFESGEAGMLSVFRKEDTEQIYTNPNILFEASQRYQHGMTALNAAVSPDHPLYFQSEFANLRCGTIRAHAQLAMTCKQIQICPPPAIANADAGPSSSLLKDDIASKKCGMLSTQLKACADEFLAVASRYGNIHVTSFDADPMTLADIDILQQSCAVMSYAIETLVVSKGQDAASLRRMRSWNTEYATRGGAYHALAISEAFEAILGKLEKVLHTHESSTLSNLHTDCLLQCSAILLSVPLSFPRYFYQSLQKTTIKLAISPSQRSTNEHITVDINERLALKIEGVIRHGGPGGMTLGDDDAESWNRASGIASGAFAAVKGRTFRHVREIKLSVRTSKSSVSGNSANVSAKVLDKSLQFLDQIVKPHNDYFSTQFLIPFPILGVYNVTVESNLIDEQGVCWISGPTQTLTVKSCDDSARIKALQQQSQATHK